MMRVIYGPSALKALTRMNVRDRDAIDRKLERFAKSGVGDVKKLVGSNRFRLRHGVWRAVFVIEGDMIVIEIAHRREVYR
jgi:mRNA interferase RelE/StbE